MKNLKKRELIKNIAIVFPIDFDEYMEKNRGKIEL